MISIHKIFRRLPLHLFGPAFLVTVIVAIILALVLLVWKLPGHPSASSTPFTGSITDHDFDSLFNMDLDKYKSGLTRLQSNIAFQAVLIATTILVIVRKSDSLDLFGNSIPLGWLHLFLPVILVYLWLDAGFTVNVLVWARIEGIDLAERVRPSAAELYKRIFQDGGFVDAWFISFVDKYEGANYSGLNRQGALAVGGLMAFFFGTLVSATHASALAIASIGSRRYLKADRKSHLRLYYSMPLVPLFVFVVSHVLFAYGGSNRNWFQIYVAIMTMPLFGFLLWLSFAMDRKSYPTIVQWLSRHLSDSLK